MRSDGRGSTEAASSSFGPPSSLDSQNAASSAPHVPVAGATSSSDFTTRMEIWSTRVPNFYIAPFCGASAGVASGIVTCPLDVIKTKLQAQGGFARRGGQAVETKALYRGMLGTGKMIFREDGLRGLYQGLGPMLLGYLPTWAVYLAVYDRSREYFYEQTDSWWLSRGYASISAGACSTIATNPIWVIKTRLMSQSLKQNSEGVRAPWQYSSTWDAARKMYKIEGIRSFYSGLTPALLGLTHVAIQFPLYEYLKMALTGYGIGEHPDNGNSHWIGISVATFLSKICASTVTYPHEVLRTRLQTQQRTAPAPSPEGIAFRGGLHHPHDRGRPISSSSDGMLNRPRYNGIVRTCQTILQEEGWRAFYSGIGTNLFRAVPAAMTTMLTYEYLRKLIHNVQHEGELKLAMANENIGTV
ncbi:mitochondrial nicotinamide adenine dinucleotide transporter 1 [Penicillium argentinense]|uniref:Mitochondrial nicotinamide adenine dinucleotide transporter 1 n=1 Tax=Penicillium argentinense TaxID=1131581 RepID=A0A9W9F868_9EURO|nr:mitochondrial nicotinamide adenine dinucleotide transporter 1 [Penicillium argentinense]XP_056473455.1 mitochondrial nicotinamide adenine dinucleotide transporter 1 [Penicillium argentinense]KAJ5081961.1 mitochondrial nicotinamide adenine dinucleotide transporter 1 [Penicillium argentinense]KAJ5095305.1 mitochondrial nicotinamide adenine dinucleotide transporter 1 [Penicillium argentinense]